MGEKIKKNPGARGQMAGIVGGDIIIYRERQTNLLTGKAPEQAQGSSPGLHASRLWRFLS